MTRVYAGHTETQAHADLEAHLRGRDAGALLVGEVGVTNTLYGEGDVRRHGALLAGADEFTPLDNADLSAVARGGGRLLVHHGTLAIGSNITIDSVMEIPFGALLKPLGGVTITLNLPPDAGRWQIFDLSAGGTIVFAAGKIPEIMLEWFGVVAETATDQFAATQAALTTAGTGRKITWGNGTYRYDQGPLLYQSNTTFEGPNGGGAVIRSFHDSPQFRALNQATAQTRHVTWRNLNVLHDAAAAANSVGIDARNTSHARFLEGTIRQYEKGWIGGYDNGIGGGQYQEIFGSEIASCAYGIYGTTACNALRVIGGRIHSCTAAGVLLSAVSGSFIQTAIENCGIGVHVTNGSNMNSIAQTYFEGSTTAAVQFDVGTFRNQEFGNKFSATADRVLDLDGRNVSLSSFPQATHTGIGSGQNLIGFGSCEVDTDANGIADGWLMTPSIPAGTTCAIDTVTFYSGTGAQKVTIAAAGTSSRVLQRPFTLEIGRLYVLTARVRIDVAGVFGLRFGTTAADSSYLLRNLDDPLNTFVLIRQPFVATATTAVLYMHERNLIPGVDSSFWIDHVKVEHGILPTMFDNARASATWNPPSLAAGAVQSTTLAVANSEIGDYVDVSFSLALAGTRMWGEVTVAGTVTVYHWNPTAGAVDVGSGTLRGAVRKPT